MGCRLNGLARKSVWRWQVTDKGKTTVTEGATLAEIKNWLSTESDPSVIKVVGELVEMVEKAERECHQWQDYHDAEYRERKKYRIDANNFCAEVVDLKKDNAALRARCEAAEEQVAGFQRWLQGGVYYTNDEHIKFLAEQEVLIGGRARTKAFEECAEIVEDAYAPCDATERFQREIAAAIKERIEL